MTLLTVTNLSKKYQQKLAVNNVNFTFESGKCIALIGPNGAGKTTILRTLAGILKPTTGTVTFSRAKAKDDPRKYIGYLPQYPAFYSWMTGEEFLIYSGQLTSLPITEAKKRSEQLLKRIGIWEARNKRIGTYSGGMKQRLGIAQAMIHQPKLLLLDEPVSSLDPLGRREVLTIMEEIKNEMTILFSTHILTDADEISDELILLQNGEVIESGSLDELREKYQTAKIELAFADDVKQYHHKLNELPSITRTTVERNLLHVTVTDISRAREEILTKAVNEKWPLTSFTINRASLEEMFMKVVKK